MNIVQVFFFQSLYLLIMIFVVSCLPIHCFFTVSLLNHLLSFSSSYCTATIIKHYVKIQNNKTLLIQIGHGTHQ